MKPNNRREIIAQYKQTMREAGVYRIVNNKTGKYSLGSCLDVKGENNKFDFARNTNTPGFTGRKISREIQEQGFDNFSFEVLELLDIKPEMTEAEIREDLKLLEEIWREKLGKEKEY